MSKWHQIGSDRERIHFEDDFFITRPTEYNSIPIFCPVCKYLVNDPVSINYYMKFKCCKRCAMCWAEGNKKKWLSGWRPSSKEIEIEIEKRNLRSPSFRF